MKHCGDKSGNSKKSNNTPVVQIKRMKSCKRDVNCEKNNYNFNIRIKEQNNEFGSKNSQKNLKLFIRMIS
jgi:hypothetical protein